GGIRDEEGNLLCSHPRLDHPLRLDEALAWSCNDYFLSLAERLGWPTFNEYLRQYGFGAPTGIAAREEAGHLAEQGEGIRAAIGEGRDLLVTPIQLLRGYLALVNGGKLCRPRLPRLGEQRDDQCVDPKPRAILDAHRRAILSGLAGAVSYGTAAAGLGGSAADRSLIFFGKTGTAAASNRFRRHGWFVGFVAPRGESAVPPPGEIALAVLVFLRRGTGAEAAGVAAQALDGSSLHLTRIAHPLAAPSPRRIRVRLAGGQIRPLPLEEYVAGALRAELGLEREAAALAAQAIVIRTFALHNLGRHDGEGFDLCSTTHCQRFVPPAASLTPAGRAAAATSGLVLRDPAGGVAEVYYHAACGGQTSSIGTVWSVPSAPPWLRGVRDPFCAAHPNERRWEDRLTRQQIELALQADRATRGVGRLRSLTPGSVDPAGRVGQITLEGERRLRISAWDFKLLIGRRLGWQFLKSTIFDVRRDGELYIFRGRGFGHGLGLCQDGAHQMARRGRSFQQILNHYFPGTRLGTESINEDRHLLPASVRLDQQESRTLRDGAVRWIIPARPGG
ncbi:MAG: SpoIID/LytB domain-containing protein, partial [Acidobacteriota bacterium]